MADFSHALAYIDTGCTAIALCRTSTSFSLVYEHSEEEAAYFYANLFFFLGERVENIGGKEEESMEKKREKKLRARGNYPV